MKLFCIKRPCGKPSRQAFLCQWLQAPRIGNKPRNRERSSGLTLFRSLVASAAILLLLSVPLHAQTVQNPSFESPMPLPNSYFGVYGNPPIPNWTTTGNVCVWQPSSAEFTAIPDGKTVLCMDAGTATQDLGVPAAANTLYKLTVAIGQRLDGLNNTYSIALNAGTTNLCTSMGSNATVPPGTFQDVSASCSAGATPPTGNLNILLTSDGRQVEFDNVRLTSAPIVVPQRISLIVKAQLLWCAVCNQTDDVAASGSLVIAQTNGPTGTFVIRTDGSISASGIIDIAQDPLEFTLWLIDSTGTAQPGASMKLTFPRFELAGPSFTLGTFSLGVVRIAHTTDSKGNPAVRIASIDQFKML